MISLKSKFLAKVAFDDDACRNTAKHEDSDGYFGFIGGAQFENARLQPLHQAVLCIGDDHMTTDKAALEAAEAYSMSHYMRIQAGITPAFLAGVAFEQSRKDEVVRYRVEHDLPIERPSRQITK